MKFTVNDYVKIKLTEEGKAIHNAYYHALYKYTPNKPIPEIILDNEGYFEEQLWVIMHIFGPHIYNGCKVPFETEIILLEE